LQENSVGDINKISDGGANLLKPKLISGIYSNVIGLNKADPPPRDESY